MNIEQEIERTDYLVKIFMKKYPMVIKDNFEGQFEAWLERECEALNLEGEQALYEHYVTTNG